MPKLLSLLKATELGRDERMEESHQNLFVIHGRYLVCRTPAGFGRKLAEHFERVSRRQMGL